MYSLVPAHIGGIFPTDIWDEARVGGVRTGTVQFCIEYMHIHCLNVIAQLLELSI